MTVLRVAVGIITHPDTGRILIAQRPQGTAYAGFWEFPGGKLEPGESPEQALERELFEELAIGVVEPSPCIIIRHTYPEYTVELHVFYVLRFEGHARANLDQLLAWVDAEQLPGYSFLAANRSIINAIRLPDRYLITPALDEAEPDGATCQTFLGQLEHSICKHAITLLRLRQPQLSNQAYAQLAQQVCELGQRHQARVLLDYRPELPQLMLSGAGVHLATQQLRDLGQRSALPFAIPTPFWLAGSCHSAEELVLAERWGVDFAVLSPVCATPTHPERPPLSWDVFSTTLSLHHASIPVFAMGGLGLSDIPRACALGGQGVAGIRAFWLGLENIG